MLLYLFSARSIVFVNFAPVTGIQHQHHDAFVFNAANQSVIANPVAPQTGKILSKRLAKCSGIRRASNTLTQI